ncbi:glutathione S-transferase family protein [Halieaceae bacterium IMCC14734]|uniref:Glutathione S-transferase family protein n=1 Tax=Candidatus Litorirhabdus singularis TaxID=2518993 RepID=A0ABT3TKP3_9GAMM|nr:glutathione S-transferase family protein [Candidatus Litorirhabdus singularis]MCX2982815.1 glutathione S-transferase family protein [Candidatus Litorirhabdus singularis]
MIKLYGANASPFVRKVMAVLALKDLPYEHIPSMPWSGDEELARVSPLQKIPALVDGDLNISDSKVICRYLEAAYPQNPVYPSDINQRARADWFEEYGGSALAESAASIFFHRFMRPMVFKQEVDEEAVSKIVDKKLPPMLDYLESEVPADGFLFEEFGVADLALASPFVNAGYAGYTIDTARWPKMAALVERVKAHASVSPLLEVEAKAFG